LRSNILKNINKPAIITDFINEITQSR